ncbi:hypothetical protein EUTSA_v10020445mg [Eutrema salsugineum]|uniref:HAT C-terminal dimerisation domain-containing protein n=1 Tax=Eutrema salsugineum TaxID=72664 RepID=V4LWJ2_EUTSA|nr:hypothetical protein EUTSA_v10020445mg [Eutrema salsugineum]
MGKKLKSDDSVNDSVDDSVDDSADDCMDDFEDDVENDFEYDLENDFEDDEEILEDNVPDWFISAGINPDNIRKEVLKIYEAQKEKAKKFLSDFQGNITLSYEWLLHGNEWTSEYSKGRVLHEDFVCMTAHFVDDSWKVRKWILGYSTGESIPLDDIFTYHFRTAVQGFEIENKVSTILLPNDEDFDEKTVDAIRKCIEAKGNSSINPPVFVVNCCADLFRLMVNDLYSGFSWSLYEDVRMLVGWGRCSSTNWNVKLYHLQQAVDMKNEDVFSKDEIYDDYDKPSDKEWIKIQTFCKLTGCIYKVAKELFEEGYATSNVYFHLLAELKVMLNQELASSDNDYFLRKAKKMLKMFDKYWNDMFLVLATASVLDPRFKMNYIEFYCSKKIDNDEGSKAETVLDCLRNLYARYAANEICQKPICPAATIGSKEEDDDEEGEEEDYDDEEGEREAEKEKEEKEFQESELDSYLKEPVMEWNKGFKALEWWKEESQKYPILSRVARDILSIPISRATSYDAYVSDRREPSELVLSEEPKMANALMCGRSWLKVLPL